MVVARAAPVGHTATPRQGLAGRTGGGACGLGASEGARPVEKRRERRSSGRPRPPTPRKVESPVLSQPHKTWGHVLKEQLCSRSLEGRAPAPSGKQLAFCLLMGLPAHARAPSRWRGERRARKTLPAHITAAGVTIGAAGPGVSQSRAS